MEWFLIDTDFGSWVVNLKKVNFITCGYQHDEGWTDEDMCHMYLTKFHMDNGTIQEACLNRRGYKALLEALEIKLDAEEKRNVRD